MSLIKNLVKEPVNKTTKNDETSEDASDEAAKKPRPIIKSATDLQRLKLEKLMRNPEKPIAIPEQRREKDHMQSVPTFVRNVMGSSAGAGSGEFHVYRHLRRKEYARQKAIQAKSTREQMDDDYHSKLEENKRAADEKTAKKRAKRLKKKQRQRNNKRTRSAGQQQQREEQTSSESEDDDNATSPTNESCERQSDKEQSANAVVAEDNPQDSAETCNTAIESSFNENKKSEEKDELRSENAISVIEAIVEDAEPTAKEDTCHNETINEEDP